MQIKVATMISNALIMRHENLRNAIKAEYNFLPNINKNSVSTKRYFHKNALYKNFSTLHRQTVQKTAKIKTAKKNIKFFLAVFYCITASNHRLRISPVSKPPGIIP